MMTDMDWTALALSLQLAAVTTLILLIIGLPTAWWLARSRWKGKFIIETLVALPLVLPPTVIGFYLLISMAPTGWLGSLVGPKLAFSFSGLLIGSVIYSLPFVIQPLQTAFGSIRQPLLDTAATLGANPIDRFLSIVLPLSKPGLIAASVLGFAHTLGEFGVVLMIGGNIPGETRVASIAIYDHVDALDFNSAHQLSLILLIGSFLLLAIVYASRKGSRIA